MPDTVAAPSHPWYVHPAVQEHTRCRICRASLHPILSLGTLALSDFPRIPTGQAHPAVPLDLVACTNPLCGLVQLAHTAPADWFYGGDQYWYFSGINETMRAELHDVVAQGLTRVDVPPHATVIDIGANDGTLLSQYQAILGPDHPLVTVAYEPAASHYEALRPHATVLFPDYFKAGDHPWEGAMKARIVTAVAMFYDLDDPHTFVADLAKVLHSDGLIIIQQAYLPAMLATTDVTNIVHEHLEYYHLRPLEALLSAHGLEVVDVDLRTINGGSFRVYVQFKGRGQVSPKVVQRRAEEDRLMEHQELLFQHFSHKAAGMRTQLRSILEAYRDQNAPVDLIAASTKANTLLQWCGIDRSLLRQAWERTPKKIGRYVGTSGIPIVSEEDGRADPPAALLAGAWQFRESFLQREAEYLAKGGRIVFPLPYVESVEAGQVVRGGEEAKL